MPPCTSFEERLEVPEAQSRASRMPTLSPRVTASIAQPAPTMPPPTTRMSSSLVRRRSRAASRCSGPSFVERVTELGVFNCCSPSSRRGVSLTLTHSVRRNNHFNALELLEIRVAGRRHRAPQAADEVGGAVRNGGRAVEDLLERGHGPDLDALAARELRVVRLRAPVETAAGGVGGAGQGGAEHDGVRAAGDRLDDVAR